MCPPCFAMAVWPVQAFDPELIVDFAMPAQVANVSNLDGHFFTAIELSNISAKEGNFAMMTPVNLGTFPALQGLSVFSTLQYPSGALNVPHMHPRDMEVLFVLEGVLDVELINTTRKLFIQTLQAGDVFVFPKASVHFQINCATYNAKALAGFSSSDPGLVRLLNSVFKSSTSDAVLATSLGVSSDVINQLTAATVN